MVTVELLRRYPLFARQSYYMLDEIAMISEEVEVKKGEWLFHEDEEATKFYLILEGKVALTMYLFIKGEGQQLQTTSPLEKAEIVGWSALVKPYKYTMGAIAEENSRILAIDAKSLRELMDDNPEYGYHLIKNVAEVISERLTYKCIQLLSLVPDTGVKHKELT